jgi:ferrous iron transport protein A
MDATVSHLIISHSYGDLYPVAGFRVRVIRMSPPLSSNVIKLSEARVGDRGVITSVGTHCHHEAEETELERRLLELGLVEGANIELIHQGLFGRDPIAVKVDDMRVALRRKEAASLTLELSPVAEAAE